MTPSSTTVLTQSAPATAKIGWVLGGLAAAFLVFDGVIHVLMLQPVIDSAVALGYPLQAMRAIGVLELACLVLYLVPRTSILGAVLLTGYLGGAMSAQVRVESPLFSTALFPVYVAIAVWGALYLRDADLRRLVPLRRR